MTERTRTMRKTIIFLVSGIIATGCSFNAQSTISDNYVRTFISVPVQKDDMARNADGLMELPGIDKDDVIITHKGYTLSYDPIAHIPEWVAYELTSDETKGEAQRDDSMFQMDPQYRKTQAMREDYSGSGWTKGHMACAADFRWDETAMDETFYLTNICPQNEELNKGDWNYLEKQCRYWARDYGKVWIVSGPIIGDNIHGRIGERNVVVPDAFFKTVLVEKKGKYHAIAFVMDNDDKRYYLDDCSMTVNELESLTGLDFFPRLYDNVEESVESRIDFNVWGIRDR